MHSLKCLCVLILAMKVSGKPNGDDKEIDILWEKYGDLKADVEELKAKDRHSQNREDGILNAIKKNATNNQKEDKDRDVADDKTIEFDFQIQYAAINVLRNNNTQYVIEVKVPDDSDTNCVFKTGGREDAAIKEVTKQGNIVRGTLTSSTYLWVVSFLCNAYDSAVEAAYYFRKPDLDSKNSSKEATFNSYKCKLEQPEHDATNSAKILKSQASCSGRPIFRNNTELRIWGFQVEGNEFQPVFTVEEFNRTFNHTEDSIDAEFSASNELLSRKAYLLELSLSLEETDPSNSLSRTDLIYFYSRAFDGSGSPIKPGTLAIYKYGRFSGTEIRKEKGSIQKMFCLAIGNPKPEVSLLKDGSVINAEENKRSENHVWSKYLSSKSFVINNVSEEDVGVYTCKVESGDKTLTSDTTLVLCVTPSVNYTYRQNRTTVQVTFQSISERGDSIKDMQCYNSTNTSYDNSIRYLTDNTPEPLVDIIENNNGSRFEMQILWRKDRNNVIPRNLYCWVYTTCASNFEKFPMKV